MLAEELQNKLKKTDIADIFHIKLKKNVPFYLSEVSALERLQKI